MTNKKFLADGSVIEKVVKFSEQGLERKILKDGQKIGTIIPRLNQDNNAQNWLSMQQNPLGCYENNYEDFFGEVNEKNKLQGRGIAMWNGGIGGRRHNNWTFIIGYFENGDWSTGKYIVIHSDGDFRVGEIYEKDGDVSRRGTEYLTAGTEEKYDW